MPKIDISSLSETAIRRQQDLKMLPYAVLSETLGLHGITLFPGIQNKDVITEFQRKSGILKPYSTDTEITDSEVGQAKEMELEVKTAYANVKDNIKDYQKVSIGPDNLLNKNKTKKHPWEIVMLSSTVRTFGEDIIDALFHATRDKADQSPMGAFDGYDTKIDAFVAGGEIAAGKGNLKVTGAIAKPINEADTAAYDILLDFYRSSHPKLRDAKKSNLSVPYDLADAYDDAYFNKMRTKPVMDAYGRTILHGSGGKCTIVRSSAMGTGQRIRLEIPGLLHFGMNTLGDETFVQVRHIDVDPNIVRFWIQGDYGTRIASIHPKFFQINEGAPVANSMSGDYV